MGPKPGKVCDSIRVSVSFVSATKGMGKVLFSISTLFLLMLKFFLSLDEAKKLLKESGFVQVSERDNWNLEAGKRYFFTRNYSTIVAFAIGKKYVMVHRFGCSLITVEPFSLLIDINSGCGWLPGKCSKRKDIIF